MIFAGGGADPAKAAKAASTKIPIVFNSAADPVRTGLVASISRPGGNITGISLLASALDAKKLGFLRELVPHTPMIGALVNPNSHGRDCRPGCSRQDKRCAREDQHP